MTPSSIQSGILQRIGQSPARVAMRARAAAAWRSITYAELGAHVEAVATWLLDGGVRPGDRVAIFAPNTPWWTVADLAAMRAGAIPVPLYATSAPATVAHVLADAGAQIVFAGGAEQLAMLRGLPGLAHIVAFEATPEADDPRVTPLAAVLAHPPAPHRLAAVPPPGPDDIATIVYTSGTTGEPKGVVLTHANLATQFHALDAHFAVTPEDRSLCFLPLSHMYERAWTWYVLRKGAENVYLANPRLVAETMAEVRPTCMVSVPRLFEKVHATARHRAAQGSAAKRRLFDWALGVGTRAQEAMARGETPGPLLRAQHAVADRLVLRRIRDAVGGPKTVFSAGGAALSADIERFFFAAGLLVCQGYGLTETSPMLTCNRPGAFRFGTVGRPIPGCELRIAEDGEVLARGPNVSRGYYRRPDLTAAAFEDGWFRTGDIGEIDADGYLRITDRKKDLIITSGGKNVAPSRIESVIGQDFYIEQVATVGEGRHYLTALVVPQFEALEAWARERGITHASMRALVADSRVVSFLAERIERQQAELAEYERVKRFTLLPERFSTAGGEITPTLKNIRGAIAAKYADVIEAMYARESA